jgi:hypothetical protein
MKEASALTGLTMVNMEHANAKAKEILILQKHSL